MQLRAISLFSGAGGMDLGFERAGFNTVVAVEMDKDACATFKRNFPVTVLVERRVEEITSWSPWRPAVVYGGPPCQPFSAAGKGAGAYDPRDGFPHAIEVVRQLKPRAFVFENVRGLTFKTHQAYLHRALGDLGRLGYNMHHRVLDAADYGVPQRRHRLFIVGFRDKVAVNRFSWPEPTHGDPKRFLFGRQPWVTVREALNLENPVRHRSPSAGTVGHLDEPSAHTSTKGVLYEEAALPIMDAPSTTIDADPRMSLPGHHSAKNGKSQKGFRVSDKHPAHELEAPALTISSGGSGHEARHEMLAMTNGGIGRADPINLDSPSAAVLARTYKDSTDLTGWVEKKRKAGGPRKGERLLGDAPAPAQGAADGGRDFVRTGATYRRLTWQECAKLQAFPDDFTFTGKQGSRYRQIGNAVPPPLAEAVARSVMEALR